MFNTLKRYITKSLLVLIITSGSVMAVLDFRHTVTGEVLDFSFAKQGTETPTQKNFMETGKNNYNNNLEALKSGESLYLTGCSGCHGHEGEGKIGPGLNDDYWTYPKNMTDKGLFETIFGGAQGMMGPQYKNMTIDDMLHVMAWIRHFYKGDPQKAEWLTPEERQQLKPAAQTAQ